MPPRGWLAASSHLSVIGQAGQHPPPGVGRASGKGDRLRDCALGRRGRGDACGFNHGHAPVRLTGSLGGHPVGRPHDVFGLCTTLYALFSGGRLGFEADSDASVTALRKLQIERRPPMRALRRNLDTRLSRLVSRGLSPHVFRRPSMRRIVLTLEAAQARVGTARPPTLATGDPPRVGVARSPLRGSAWRCSGCARSC